MSKHPLHRTGTALAVLSAVAGIAALPGGAAAAGHKTPTISKAERQCLAAVIVGARKPADAAAGSASASLLSQFAVLRRAARSTDALAPVAVKISVAAGNGVTFDPQRLRRLSTDGKVRVYIVPATVKPPVVPGPCVGTKLAAFAKAQAKEQTLAGTGSGVCVISTTGTAECESTRVLDGFGGFGASVLGAHSTQQYPVPDGVKSLRLRFSTGHRRTVPVRHNLAIIQLKTSLSVHKLSVAQEIAQTVPTSVTWVPTAGGTARHFTRPAGFIATLRSALGQAAKLSKTLGISSGGSSKITPLG